MFGPLPARFVTRAPDSHPADSDDVEPAFLKYAGFVWFFKPLQNRFYQFFLLSERAQTIRFLLQHAANVWRFSDAWMNLSRAIFHRAFDQIGLLFRRAGLLFSNRFRT